MMYRPLLLLWLSIFTNVDAAETFILARAPQLSPSVTSKEWTPFVKYLSEKTSSNIILKVYSHRTDFEQDIQEGKVDIYYGNPGYGVVGHLKHGYLPIIRSDQKELKGIVVARKDSGISDIKQLHGQTIAFPSSSSFAASLYLRSILKTDFGIDFNTEYLGTHDNVYRSILVGKSTAGGGVYRTLNREDKRVREQLQIIYETPGMKPHPLMISKNIGQTMRKKIQQAILELNTTNEGKELLKTIKIQKPVKADYQRDYKSIEALVLNMYDYLLK